MSDHTAMACPVCRVPLTMSERQGIEIDYCPQCRGVWLDRGELDKIIERTTAEVAPPRQPAPPPPPPQGYAPPPPQGYAPQPPYPGHYGKPRKHKHWLSEIFD